MRKMTWIIVTAVVLALIGLVTVANADGGKKYTAADAEMIAKTVWGEARGCSATEQAGVVWCILNRVDDGRYPDNIEDVVTAKWQFMGYNSNNPVDDDILALTYDVLARWCIEDRCVGDVGRVLPKEYLFFSGDGRHNYFRTGYLNSATWDWSNGSPYEVSE